MDGKIEVMTTHQRIQEQHRRNVSAIVGEGARDRQAQLIATSDLDQIKMVLQALMDKLEGLNLYVRSLHATSTLGKMKPMTEAQESHDYTASDKTSIDFGRPLLASDAVLLPRETKLIEGEIDDNTCDSA